MAAAQHRVHDDGLSRSLCQVIRTVVLVATAPLTSDALRCQVEAVVVPFGLSVDQFVASDVDDLPSDVWLMVNGALVPSP